MLTPWTKKIGFEERKVNFTLIAGGVGVELKLADENSFILKLNEAEYSISRGHRPVLAQLTSKWPRLLSHAASEACIPEHTNSAPCTSLTSRPSNTINTPLSSNYTHTHTHILMRRRGEKKNTCSYQGPAVNVQHFRSMKAIYLAILSVLHLSCHKRLQEGKLR